MASPGLCEIFELAEALAPESFVEVGIPTSETACTCTYAVAKHACIAGVIASLHARFRHGDLFCAETSVSNEF